MNASRVEARAASFRRASTALLVALIALSLAWELALAPLRPGGSWLALKALPLLLPLPGVLRGRVYTYRWSTLLVLLYFGEGCARAYTDAPPASTLAWLEIALTLLFCAAAAGFLRATRAVRAAAD